MSTLLEHKIAFSSLKGLNLALGRRLLSSVVDERFFFEATESQLSAAVGSKNKIFDAAYRGEVLAEARREADYVLMSNIRFHYFTDEDFPARLLECDDAPMGFFTFGDCDLNSGHVVSIVGTRHATPYGLAFINNLVADLSRKLDGLVIVSGLAYGADIAAHRAAVANNVPTVAVFGHGLEMVYPAAHRSDAAAIIKAGGSVLTEYHHSTPIHRANFLMRNRIVAGLSDCVIVVESAVKGGALATARIASQYGRDVFALPGRTSDIYSQGCNSLIASNVAGLVQSADDVISAMGWQAKPEEGDQQQMFVELSETEQLVVDYLRANSEAQINKLSVDTGLQMGRLMSVLVDLEFKGLILNYPGGRYRLA